jgi:hypothetical protein
MMTQPSGAHSVRAIKEDDAEMKPQSPQRNWHLCAPRCGLIFEADRDPFY